MSSPMTGSPNSYCLTEKMAPQIRKSTLYGSIAMAAVLVVAVGWVVGFAHPAAAQNPVGPPVKLLKKQDPVGGQKPTRLRPGQPVVQSETAPPKATEGAIPEAAPDAIQVQSLAAVDVSSAGLLDDADGGLGVDMWQGIARSLVEKLLPRLPVATTSPAMQGLARRLLLTRARVPGGAATAQSLLGLRVERLAAAGDTVSVNALMNLAPANFSDQRVSRAKVDGLLLSGDTAGACADFQALVGEAPEVSYWVKGLAFCRALGGAHEQATFAADLLRDLGEDDPPFFTLLGVLSGNRGLSLESLLDPTPLHIAMMKTARLPVPVDAIAGASPGILAAIGRSPNADLDLRLAAAERAEAAGALDAALLAEIYRSVTFAPEELADAPTALKQLTAPRTNALLYQVGQIQEVPTARAEALALAWRLAHERGTYATAVRVSLPSLQALEPTPELAWFAIDAVRALYTAGDIATAQRWFAMVQANASPGNADAALAVLRLWPLPFLRDPRYQQGWDGIAILGPWLQGMGALDGLEGARAKQVELILTLLAALDFEIPDTVWPPLFQGSLTVSTSIPAAGLWIHLRSASLSGEVGATVLFAMLALGEGGPTTAEPIVLAEIIAALRRVNLDDAARQIAVEAAMVHLP